METHIIVSFLVGIVVAYFGGFVGGHTYGVKETEGRWSEAVRRADAQREVEHCNRIRCGHNKTMEEIREAFGA